MMTVAVHTMPASAQEATAVHALRTEAYDYRRLSTMLRGIRELFSNNDHDAVKGVCTSVLRVARGLEQRAQSRIEGPGLKALVADAEDDGGGMGREFRDACTELLESQMEARAELIVTLEILSDLQAHTVSLRSALLGESPVTYDHTGQTQAVGG